MNFFFSFNTKMTIRRNALVIKYPVTLTMTIRVQELRESRGDRPGLPVLMSLTVSVDVKQH